MSTQDLKLRVLFDMIDGATRPLKNILAGNRDLAKSLKGSRDALKDLGKTQKEIGAFRELLAGSKATAAQLAAAQAKVDQMAASTRQAGPQMKGFAREFERAKAAAATLKQEHDKEIAALAQLRTRLTGAGVDTRNLSQHERNLRSNIAATNAAMLQQQARLSELTARERKLADLRQKMRNTQAAAGAAAGTGARAMGAGVAVGAPIGAAVSAYAKAEDSATQLQVSLMRAGATVPPEFQKINDLAMKLGDRLPGATSDYQDMMTMLIRQGMSATSILGGLGEATALLSVQLKKAPGEAAEFAAKLQDATRTTEGDMLGLMDVIQRAFYLGVDDNNMLQGFAKLSPALDILKAKGLAGAKALAPLLVLADQAGMRGEAAGNAYRKMFQLSMDADKVGKANKEIGGGAKLDFTDGKGEFAGLDNMFAQLDKLKGLTTQKRLEVIKTIFGDDAETLQAVTLMMDKGVSGYAEVQAKMSAQASLQERVNKQLGTLKNLWEAASGTFTNALVAFGEAISPEVKEITEWLGRMSASVGAWARENPALAGGIMKVVAVLAVLLTVGGALTLMLASILGPLAIVKFGMAALGMQGGALGTVLRLVGQGVMFIGRALLMNPIGLAITGIALAAYLIYKYWEPIKGFFAGLLDQIRMAVSGGLAGIGALIMNWSPWGLFYQAFAAVMSWFGIEMPAKFSQFGANLLTGLINGITGGLGMVKEAITNVANTTVTWFKEKLGIHSPSRVFGELGGYIGQGAAIGIESEKPGIAKATAALAAAAATSFSPASAMDFASPLTFDTRAPIQAAAAPASAAPAGGNTYTIVIQGAGQDPQTLAKLVAAEIERIEQRKQARNTSRLKD